MAADLFQRVNAFVAEHPNCTAAEVAAGVPTVRGAVPGRAPTARARRVRRPRPVDRRVPVLQALSAGDGWDGGRVSTNNGRFAARGEQDR